MNTGRIFVILRKNPDTLTQKKTQTHTNKQTENNTNTHTRLVRNHLKKKTKL